jgi:cysteinyl-tRNA synthetase
MPLRLYNTLSRQTEPFRPIDPAHVTFYTCGPTVYDDAHIGNFRSFLAADLLRRFLESPLCEVTAPDGSAHRGPRRVTHVMNITDVGHMTDDAEGGEHGEDRMAVAGRRILEQKKSGKLPPGSDLDPSNPYDIARFYAARFLDDARRLGLKVALDAQRDPTLMPYATANVPGMIRAVELLVRRGHAYAVGRPGSRVVYFDVRSFPAYGRLSGNTLDALREGAGGRIAESDQSSKLDPADFLLWKEDPTHIMKWDSPWGPGYPGWHIECSVMSAARLGAPALRSGRPLTPEELVSLVVPDGQPIIDLHSGGEDNIFPHHECEIAQSCACFNAAHAGPYAAMWFHPRFLFVEGAKMSKSKGNFFTARQLTTPAPEGKGFEPAAVRLELIKTHYRSNANFTEQGLRDSARTVDRWRRFAEAAAASGAPGDEPGAAACRAAVAEALHDDLNVAGAIGEINAWMGRAAAPGRAEAALLKDLDAVLGVLALERPQAASTDVGVFVGCDPDPAVLAKLTERVEAKKSKDFARSDAIRAELAAMGYQIKDVAGGKVEVRRG